jgi:uncharacterized membrane protein HdeD (DUF308 family)
MMRRISLIERHPASSGWWLLFFQGVLLIALAGLVLYQPAILVHLAAALFAVIGGFCIVFAWRARRIGRARTYRYWSESWWADAL